MTLNAANTYKLSWIVVVKSPAVLTVPAGTVFKAIQYAKAPGW
ncbi:hypothetical protein [Arachidicoccus ginsenosidivorans]|jgi:hypothetical protein|nr:hypothetical protein [Arachidicoccus ginsenosidivorans]